MQDTIAGIKDETEVRPEPIKDDIQPVSFVKQTFGEAKPKYYVMMVGGGVPTRPHRSRWWAEQEAKRLAAQFPDKVFHVLKVKSTFESKSQDIAAAEARINCKIGQMVRIGKFHFRNPNELGEIVGFTPVGAVEIKLQQSGEVYPFAATSFKPLNTPDVGTIVTTEGGVRLLVPAGEQVPDGIDA